MDIKKDAINKAIRLLDAVKAQYKIITEDGEKFGVLEVMPPASTRTMRYRVFAQTGYMEKIKTLEVGSVISFSPPDGSTAEQMRSAVCGSLNRLFGAGSCMTTINKVTSQVEILRVS